MTLVLDNPVDTPDLDRDALIRENRPLAVYLARDKHRTADHVELDDLISAAHLGLVRAAREFDPTAGAPFGAYARQLIRWAMADEMRGQDPLSEHSRGRVKRVLAAVESLRHKLMREPTTAEIAREVGMPEPLVDGYLQLDDITRIDGDPSELDSYDVDSIDVVAEVVLPDQEAERNEQQELLHAAMDALPERLRQIVHDVYVLEKSVVDVARDLGVSHAAISKQRAQALLLLRDAMAAWEGEPLPERTSKAREAFFRRIAENGPSRIARSFRLDQAA